MRLVVEKSERLEGCVSAPPSKSHTHRAVILASLADGASKIRNPLLSNDCLATVDACRAIGAEIDIDQELKIKGVAGKPGTPDQTIDVRNSGTTIRLMTSIVALCEGSSTLTGDESIRKRPMDPLLKSLNDIGAGALSILGNGNPPVRIKGRMKGGSTTIEGISSQFVSGLLIACSLAEADTEITVLDLKSRPYVDMTLSHLNRVGIKVHRTDQDIFQIPGNQRMTAQDYTIPGDFSSAAFLLAAAHITNSDIIVSGLDMQDPQADKAILNIIEEMKNGEERTIDLGNSPDLLPITAVLGCYAGGTTVIKNVEHARLKESDRISSMCSELVKMGADIEELDDGLLVRNSNLKGARLEGHEDHRVVMALAVAALGAEGTTEITDAETIGISFPEFISIMRELGANMRTEEA